MKKKFRALITLGMLTVLLLTGCTSGNGSTQSTSADSSSDGSAATASDTATGTSDVSTTTVSTTSTIVIDKEYSAKDLEVGYEESTATKITLNGSSIEVAGEGANSEGGVVTISDEGTYIITGTLNNGQILVDAEETDKVKLVFNGITIQNQSNAPVYIKSADKVFITLAEGSNNTLTDGTEYTQTDDNTVDGVIFSMADLTINGEGSLNINGNYQHGIASKDDLIITGGIFNISAVKDALNGKDCVKINDGTFTLSSSTGNGIQSKNSDDSTKGYIYISGGDITVTNSEEGIEGTVILIEEGNVDVTASDDGFNAASGDSSTSTTDTAQNLSAEAVGTKSAGDMGRGRFGGGTMENDSNCYISISGGNIKINASGDGIDSNGSVEVSGGTVYVSGPTDSGNAAFDYNGTANISGGTVVIAGSAGMAQGFSDTSTQYSLLYNLSSISEAGTEITLTDSKGTIVASFTPEKQYQSVIISTPDLVKDGVYTLTCGDQTNEITLSSIVTSNGQTGMNGKMGGRGGFGRGQMPEGTMPEDGAATPPDMGTTPDSSQS